MIADRQTAGRGRIGRHWLSPEGNIYASTLVRLRATDPPAPTLSLAAGYALWCAVLGRSQLKWPNDLMIDDAKVAGILLERQSDIVVVGFGVNVSVAPKGLGRPVTTVAEHAYVNQTSDEIFDRLCGHFARLLNEWRQRPLSYLCSLWMSEAHPLGTKLSVSLPDGLQLAGVFEGLSDDGALRLRLADGQVRVIHAGDVFLV